MISKIADPYLFVMLNEVKHLRSKIERFFALLRMTPGIQSDFI